MRSMKWLHPGFSVTAGPSGAPAGGGDAMCRHTDSRTKCAKRARSSLAPFAFLLQQLRQRPQRQGPTPTAHCTLRCELHGAWAAGTPPGPRQGSAGSHLWKGRDHLSSASDPENSQGFPVFPRRPSPAPRVPPSPPGCLPCLCAPHLCLQFPPGEAGK